MSDDKDNKPPEGAGSQPGHYDDHGAWVSPSVVITPPGVGLKHPEGVPEENIGQPEFTDWRERAFALAVELNECKDWIASGSKLLKDMVASAEQLERLLQIAEREIVRRDAQRPVVAAYSFAAGAFVTFCLFGLFGACKLMF